MCDSRLTGDCPHQPLVVRHSILQGWNIHNNIQNLHVVFLLNPGINDLFSGVFKNLHFFTRTKICHLHSASIGRCNIRNLQRHIADNRTAAGKPPALCIFLVSNVPCLLGIQLSA